MAYKRVFIASICLLLASGAVWSLDVNLSQFVLNDVELGGSVSGHTYLKYDCRASEQFSGFIWCQNRRMERTRIGTVVISKSILHDGDGKVAYVSEHIAPVVFTPEEIEKTVSLITAKYGEAAQVMHPSSPWGIDRDAVIAIWGQINLEPLDSSTLSIIASGHDVKSGLRVDYLGDFRKSAKLGMPIYRIAGGPGYLWNASYDRKGRGHLRFLTSNAAAYAVPIEPNKKPAQSEGATGQNGVSSFMADFELPSRPVTERTDADDPKRIAYDKSDADEINQASTRSFDWAAAITIVVCAIASLLFLGLGVSRKLIAHLNRRRNQRSQSQSDDDPSGTQEYFCSDYDGYNGADCEAWYEVLEVSAKASAEEIKRAWHDKVQKNHPDRVADLDVEFRKLADQRTKKLNNARDQGLINLNRVSALKKMGTSA